MSNEDKVVKLVDEWAMRFEGDVLEGIAQLNEAYKDDKMMSKALMDLIALQYPQFKDIITSYLKVHFYIAEDEKPESLDPVPFNLVKELIYTQVTTITLLLQLGENKEAKERLEEIIEHLSDFVSSMAGDFPGAEVQDELSTNIHKSIKAVEKHLDRLSDFVIVANEDKLLSEIIAFKRALAVLEEQLQSFICNF
jgi:hypothetical protein